MSLFLSACLRFFLHVSVSVCMSLFLSACLRFFLHVSVSVCMSLYLSACLCMHPYVSVCTNENVASIFESLPRRLTDHFCSWKMGKCSWWISQRRSRSGFLQRSGWLPEMIQQTFVWWTIQWFQLRFMQSTSCWDPTRRQNPRVLSLHCHFPFIFHTVDSRS